MFGKSTTKDWSEFRKAKRWPGDGVVLKIEGKSVNVVDYSDTGVRAKIPESVHQKTVILELFKNNKLIHRSPAVVAWVTENERGYEFRGNLNTYDVETSHDIVADAVRKRNELNNPSNQKKFKLKTKTKRPQSVSASGTTEEPPKKNKTGGVSGDTLKNRLKF